MFRSFRVILLFGALALWPGAALFARMPTEVRDDTPRDYWQFLFLYESTYAAGQREYLLHPLYGKYRNEERAYTYKNILYPVFYSHGTNYWNRWTFLYFFTGDEQWHADTADDTDILTPFFYIGWGKSEKENYWSVFPFYGKVKNKLSYSEINYVLFPLYANWSYKEYKAHGVLWPFVMWGGGNDRRDFRIFPFYSHKIHAGKYTRRTVLWPFFQWGSEDLDKKEPRHYFLSVPLYGRKWSDGGNLSAHTFLWLPLLGGLFSYGTDRATGGYDLNVLWFLYQKSYHPDPQIRKHIIFPFWGYYRFGNTDKDDETYFNDATFISPLYVSLRTRSAVMDSDYRMFIPFFWHDERWYRKERESESYVKLWPLFSYVGDSRGRTTFRSLTLWPLRSDEFERMWGTLWSLTEYRVEENGDRYFSIFLRLYSRYWNEFESHQFLLGFEFHNTPAYWSVNFLGGLFGYRRDLANVLGADGSVSSGRHTIQLFWFDL